jgi:hypothetical protein
MQEVSKWRSVTLSTTKYSAMHGMGSATASKR